MLESLLLLCKFSGFGNLEYGEQSTGIFVQQSAVSTVNRPSVCCVVDVDVHLYTVLNFLKVIIRKLS